MKLWHVIVVLLLTGVLGCSSLKLAFGDDDDYAVPLSEVPEAALEAARSAIAGITLTEAEMEQKGGCTVYEIEGTADGVQYEIEVTAAGKVLEVEREDEK